MNMLSQINKSFAGEWPARAESWPLSQTSGVVSRGEKCQWYPLCCWWAGLYSHFSKLLYPGMFQLQRRGEGGGVYGENTTNSQAQRPPEIFGAITKQQLQTAHSNSVWRLQCTAVTVLGMLFIPSYKRLRREGNPRFHSQLEKHSRSTDLRQGDRIIRKDH